MADLRADMSGGGQAEDLPAATTSLQLAQQQIRHRESLFAIAVAAGVVMYLVFVAFLFSAASGLDHNRLIALGILGAMPASVLLGLMRFVFRKEKDHDDSGPADFSVLLSLVKQAAEIIKEVAQRGK